MKLSASITLIAFLLAACPALVNCETEHSARYYNSLGVESAQNEDVEQAIEYFSKAIEIDPKYARAYINLGIIYMRKSEYGLAQNTLEKALELDPDSPEIYSNLGTIYEKAGDYERAIEYSKKALSAKENNPVSIYNLGYAYLLEGDRDSAMKQYGKLKEMRQEELAAKLLGKITQAGLGKTSQAQETAK